MNKEEFYVEFVPWVKFVHSHLMEIILGTIHNNGNQGD